MTTVGLVLLAIVPLLVIEGIAYSRGGMMSEFWGLPLDAKLDHVAEHVREWWVMGIVWVPMLAVTLGGMTALAWLLADEASWIALGGLAVAAASWLFGITVQTAGTSVAVRDRVESGATPQWLRPLWAAAWMCELSWVTVANLAYIAFGIAIVGGDRIGDWAGWAAISIGAVVVAAVVATRQAFPQLGLLVPVVLGIAAFGA